VLLNGGLRGGFGGGAGEDHGFDFGCDAVGGAREHAAEDVGEIFEGRGAGEEVLSAEAAGSNEVEGSARGCGGVVKAGLEGEVGVVDEVGVERDRGAAGRTAEEVDEAAFAGHLNGPLPGFGSGDGLEDDVGAAAFGCEGAGSGDGVGDVRDAEDLLGAKVTRRGDLVFALDHGNDAEAEERGSVDEEQADGAGAEDDDGLAGMSARLFEAADDAGKGFGEGCVFERDGFGNLEGILFDDACRDAKELGVGAVVEEEVVAEVLLVVAAEETGVARRGVEGKHTVAESKSGSAVADLDDGSGELVAEEAVGGEHFGVVAAAVDLEVGTAGEGRAYAQDQLARARDGDGDVLDAEVFPAAKGGGSHGSA